MKKIIILCSVLALVSVAALAGAPQNGQYLNIDNSGHSVKSLPLGNTWDNNMLVFYEVTDGSDVLIKGRLVTATGSLPDQPITYSPPVEYGKWTACWSPLAKIYMLVYVENGHIYARPINRNGTPKSGAFIIASNYDSDKLFLTFTAKRRFTLFLEVNDQIVALSLTNKGKRKGNESTLTSLPVGKKALITSCSTENNGDTVVYYSLLDTNSMKTDLMMKRVDVKLAEKAEYTIKSGLKAKSDFHARFYLGACDYGDDLHMVVWQIGKKSAFYALVKADGTLVKKAVKTPEKRLFPRKIDFDWTSDIYRLFYMELKSQGSQDVETFFFTNIRDDASVANKKEIMATSVGEADYRTFGFSKDGNILITWSPEILMELNGYFLRFPL